MTRRAATTAFGLLVVLGAATVVDLHPLHAPANYDEAVYLSTARELAHGNAIGHVFLSQPPGFGWVLAALGQLTSSLTTDRAVMLLFALLGSASAYALGRALAGRLSGLFAAAGLAIAPPWPAYATRLEADLPSTSLAIAALALATRMPFAAGAVFAVAVSVKLLAASAVVPLVLLARRRLLQLVSGAAAATVVLALSVVTHLGDVWHQSIAFHLHGRHVSAPSTGANVSRIVHFLDLHTPLTYVVAAAVIVAVVAALGGRTLPWILWTWTPVAALALVVQHPLLDHHMVLLAAAWAVPAGVALGAAVERFSPRVSMVALAAIGLVVLAGLAQQWHQLARPPTDTDTTAAVARLRSLVPPGSRVASDDQIVPYLAGDRQPPQLVDVSSVRHESGDLTDAEILRAAQGAAAFVVGRELTDDETVLAALRARYRTRVTAGGVTIFAAPR